MTNYDKMPAGREMNLLVADRVMGLVSCEGWKIVNLGSAGGAVLMADGCTHGRGECYSTVQVDSIHGTIGGCPPFSTDIAAAWEVVERLKNSTPLGDVLVWWNAGTLSSYGQPGWEAQIRDFDGDCKERTIALSGLSATAPLAICRAALRAVTP